MKIVLISIADWSLKYLDETIDKKKLADTVLITNKVTNKLKKYTNLNKVKVIKTQKISKKTFKGINVSKSLILSAGSPWIFNKSLIKHLGKNFFNVHQLSLNLRLNSV